jgi:hypothetical protein
VARFRGSSLASQAEAQRAKSAAAFLDRFVAASNQTWATHAEQPIAGSPYEAACRLAGGRWAFDFARFHLASAEDHLMTIAVILGSGWWPMYSWYALVRSWLEASARACWLLDPHLTPRQRQSRGFTEHLVKLQGDLKFARPQTKASILQKIRALRGDASCQRLQETFGRPLQKGAPKPLVGFGISRPGPSTLVQKWFPEVTPGGGAVGEFLYHVVSGPAHSEPWALLLAIERVGPDEGGIATARIEVQLGTLMPVIGKAVELHDRAVRWHTQLMGYDEAVWDDARGPLRRL